MIVLGGEASLEDRLDILHKVGSDQYHLQKIQTYLPADLYFTQMGMTI